MGTHTKNVSFSENKQDFLINSLACLNLIGIFTGYFYYKIGTITTINDDVENFSGKKIEMHVRVCIL